MAGDDITTDVQELSKEAREQIHKVALDTTRGEPGKIGVNGGDLADQ